MSAPETQPAAPRRRCTAPRVLVVMDVDGTLLLNGGAVREDFHRAFLEVTGVDISPVRVRFAGSTDRAIIREYIERGGIEGDYERIFDRVSERFCDLVEESYPDHPGPYLLPGARKLLEALHSHPEAGLVLGTGNLRRSCFSKLKRFGLEGYFPYGGGFGGDYENRADAIRAALAVGRAGYGWDKGEAWVIGDTPNDAFAAHEAGASALLVASGIVDRPALDDAGAEAVLDDLTDTARVLRILRLR